MAESDLDPAYEITMALVDIGSPDVQKRDAARERVRRLGADAVEPLVKLKGQEAFAAREASILGLFVSVPFLVAFVAVSGILTIALLAAALSVPTRDSRLYFLFASVSAVGPISAFERLRVAMGARASKANMPDTAGQSRTNRLIAGLDNVECIGKLAEQIHLNKLGRGEVGVTDPFAFALSRIVPNVGIQDIKRLTPYQSRRLFGTLEMNTALAHPDLVCEVIDLAVRCKLTEYISPIASIANSGEGREGSLRVRSVARDALDKLREIEAKSMDTVNLLRASESPDKPAETLLGPAGGASVEDSSVFLRPIVNETDL